MEADLIITGDHVFTGLEDYPVRKAVCIRGNKIISVCSPEEAREYMGAATVVKEYPEQLIMPGFFDGHVHAFLGGIFARAVDLSKCRSEAEAVDTVKLFADAHPELHWIVGTDWSNLTWGTQNNPSKHSLDAKLPDKPVYLINLEGHSAWINSAAIKESGIANHKELKPELLERDKHGELTGYISEESMLVVAALAFDMPMCVQGEILQEFLDKAKKLGVTAISNIQCYQGSDIDIGNLEILREFEREGKLTTRFFVAVGLTGDLKRPRKLREMYHSDVFSFSGLKHIVDGTATGWTALMVDPYSDKPDSIGSSRITKEDLEKRVVAADKEGFRVRMHACGDGSVRRALDCYEKAQIENGKRDSRHTIEHIEIIKKEDIPRFVQLGVVASMQPNHISLCDSFDDNPYFDRLGKDRAAGTWPIRSIMETGAHVQFGTDFPIYELNPMLAVFRATTRLYNDGKPSGGWNPSEKIGLSETLKAYTYGSAYGAFMEDKLGTLECGKYADIVVLDKNLFSLDDPWQILETKPCLTVSNGRIVFES